MKLGTGKKGKREKGQAIVEFALVLPLLIILIFSMIDFGLIFLDCYKTQSAAHEGARLAGIYYQEMTDAELRTNVETIAAKNLGKQEITGNISIVADGNYVTVEVTNPIRCISFVSELVFRGNTYNYTASATSVIQPVHSE